MTDVIRGLFGREPFDGEVAAWDSAFGGSVRLDDFVASIVRAPEYRRRIARSLIADVTQLNHNAISIIHIPKTAGTTLRLAIEQISRVPFSFVTSRGTEVENAFNWSVGSRNRLSQSHWPFLAGHFPRGQFPRDSIAYSLIRDPLSRILSLYSFARHCHGERVGTFRSWVTEMLSHRFGKRRKSLKLASLCKLHGSPNFFEDQAFYLQGRYLSAQHFRKLNRRVALETCLESAKTFRKVAWSHQQEELIGIVKDVTNEVVSNEVQLGSENVGLGVHSRSQSTIQISSSCFALIQELVSQDDELILGLSREGILSSPRSLLVRHRSDTMKRLGFTLS